MNKTCTCLKKNLDVSKPPEHSPSGGMPKDVGGSIVYYVVYIDIALYISFAIIAMTRSMRAAHPATL